MKYLIKKPTFFSIIGTILILIGLPYGIITFFSEGAKGIVGAFVIIVILAIALLVIIDRILIRKFELKKINLIELILILFGLFIYFSLLKTIKIDASNETSDYIIAIKNNGLYENSKIQYQFPSLTKKITPLNNIVTIESNKNIDDFEFDYPKKWNGFRVQKYYTNNAIIQFYYNSEKQYSQSDINSIIEKIQP